MQYNDGYYYQDTQAEHSYLPQYGYSDNRENYPNQNYESYYNQNAYCYPKQNADYSYQPNDAYYGNQQYYQSEYYPAEYASNNQSYDNQVIPDQHYYADDTANTNGSEEKIVYKELQNANEIYNSQISTERDYCPNTFECPQNTQRLSYQDYDQYQQQIGCTDEFNGNFKSHEEYQNFEENA